LIFKSYFKEINGDIMLNKNLKKLLVLAALSYSGIAFAAVADLPPEIWTYILGNLEGRALVNASEVCQQWHELTEPARAKEKQLKFDAKLLILEAGDLEKAFCSALINNAPKELIAYMVKSNLRASQRLLFAAVLLESEDIVELLLSFGLNPNLLVNGASPLHQAVASGNVAIVKTLLKAGAEKNSKIAVGGLFPLGQTPLENALESKNYSVNQNKPDEVERYDAIIRLLEEK
jgi:hypothetical protein